MKRIPSAALPRCLLASILGLTVAFTSLTAATRDTYYVTDHLATTVAAIDAAGEIAALEADAFGSPMGHTDETGRFTGKPYDADLAAFVFPFRNFRPGEARWASADPSGFPDGLNARVYKPTPTTSIDPLGLYTLSDAVHNLSLTDVMDQWGDGTFGYTDRNYGRTSSTFTWSVSSDGHCYTARPLTGVVNFSMSIDRYISNATAMYEGGIYNNDSRNDTIIHEDGHRSILISFANRVLSQAEAFGSSYVSARFRTEAQAIAAASNDLIGGLNSTVAAYYKTWTGYEAEHTTMQVTGGVWRDQNPNWASDSLAQLNTRPVNFNKTPGNCE